MSDVRSFQRGLKLDKCVLNAQVIRITASSYSIESFIRTTPAREMDQPFPKIDRGKWRSEDRASRSDLSSSDAHKKERDASVSGEEEEEEDKVDDNRDAEEEDSGDEIKEDEKKEEKDERNNFKANQGESDILGNQAQPQFNNSTHSDLIDFDL